MSKVDEQLVLDLIIYGNSYYTAHLRSKYNPMRFFLGNIKKKRINPKEIYIDKLEPNNPL
jgi:hypothetical protein